MEKIKWRRNKVAYNYDTLYKFRFILAVFNNVDTYANS